MYFRAHTAEARAEMRALGMDSARIAQAAETSWGRTTRRIASVGSAFQSVGRTMTGIGLGVGAFGYVAVKSAMNFQTAMTRIQTQAGVSAKTVNLMSDAVMKLGASGTVQYGPTELANALYHIESVGVGSYKSLQKTGVAMNVLKVAAKGAAIGGADLEETTTALMGVMFAARAPMSQASHYMGLINATVGAGNMRMGDLVTALGSNVIPAFRSLGLTATDAFGAIALLSDSGIKARSAATQLATALHFLAQPSAKADKYLHAINMTQTQMAADMNKRGGGGLLKALKDLRSHLDLLPGGAQGPQAQQAEQVLLALFPGGRGRVMQTVIQNLDRYAGKVSAIQKNQDKLDALAKAQANTLSGKLHSAWAKINTDLTQFGTTLIPIIEKYMPKFLKDVEGVLKWFTRLPHWVKSTAIEMAAIFVVGGPIMWGLGKMISLLAVLKRMIDGIRAAWIAVRGAAATAGAAEAIAAGAGGAGGAGGPKPWMVPGGPAWKKAEEAKKASKLARLGKGLGRIGRSLPIVGTFVTIGYTINEFSGHQADRVHAGGGKVYQGTPGFKVGPHGSLIPKGAHGGLVVPGGIRGYAAGGYVDDQLAALTVGEGVLNRTMGMPAVGGPAGLNALNSGAGFPGRDLTLTVNTILDGRVVARSVTQQVLRKAARGTGVVGGPMVTGAIMASRG